MRVLFGGKRLALDEDRLGLDCRRIEVSLRQPMLHGVMVAPLLHACEADVEQFCSL
jgi:hypothetical protein